MGAVTAELAKRQMEDEPLMVPGFGALPVVPPRYVAANDNNPHSAGLRGAAMEARVSLASLKDVKIGGRPLRGASFYADDLAIETFAPLGDLPPLTNTHVVEGGFELSPDSPTVAEFVESVFGKEAARGPFIQTYAGVFYPFSPRPEDVRIEDIAHGLANICRYSGACEKRYSVAEHSIHVAWWLYRRAGAQTALAGLLHDAPEALSGFGDVASPIKRHDPLINKVEDDIWRLAIAPAFGLPPELPSAVKEADDRIIGDEIVNMKPMEWHARYDDPLGVTLAYWEPAEAERRFLSAFTALSDEVKGMDV